MLSPDINPAKTVPGYHKPLNLIKFHGWISLYDVIERSGTYFLDVIGLLVQLEDPVRPRKIFDSSQTVALPPSLAAPLSATPFQDLMRAIGEVPALLSKPSSELSLSELAELTLPRPIPISNTIFGHLELVGNDAEDLGLESTAKRLKRMREYLATDDKRRAIDLVGDARMQDEVRVLRESLIDDLKERPIFFPDLQKYRKYWEKDFGDEVNDAFPDATTDICDALRCHVTDNPTASVFHSMRVAEYGLRALAKRVTPRMQSNKLEWGAIIKALRGRIEELNKPGKKRLTSRREKLLDFYSETLDQCVFFKNLWRDDTMHTRAHYESPDALKALTHVEEFMKVLANNGLTLPAALPIETCII